MFKEQAGNHSYPAAASAPTALMRQYLDVKARYPDAIVFFRLGDFYEMFYEDAVYVARALNLTLTTRDKGKDKDEAVPMCAKRSPCAACLTTPCAAT